MTRLLTGVSQLLLCILLGVTSINAKPPSAIVGGSLAGENEFPYLVGLTKFGRHKCGGVIIDSTHILTAAHCVVVYEDDVDLIENMLVVSGTNDISQGNKHRIKSIKKHPQYTPSDTWKNDIAVITLRTPIALNDRQKAVELPTKDVAPNSVATASGWGLLDYPQGEFPVELWKLEMKVIADNRECILPRTELHESQLCAYVKKGSGLCVGDSGGPLVHDGILIGIASYVYYCARGHPDVFTRVHSYLDWIEEVTKS